MVPTFRVTTGQASSGHFSLCNYSLIKRAITFSLVLQIQTAEAQTGLSSPEV